MRKSTLLLTCLFLAIISLALFCCNLKTNFFSEAGKIEIVRFSLNDSNVNIKDKFEIEFYVLGDSFASKIKGDSIVFKKVGANINYIGIRFTYVGYDLRFDSIPARLLDQKQHIAFEFGIRDSSIFKHSLIPNPKTEYAKEPGIRYQFFAINPWDSGIGQYFEKPILN